MLRLERDDLSRAGMSYIILSFAHCRKIVKERTSYRLFSIFRLRLPVFILLVVFYRPRLLFYVSVISACIVDI